MAVKCFEQDATGKWWGVFDRPNHKGCRRAGAVWSECESCREKFLRLKGRRQIFCSSKCANGRRRGAGNSKWRGGVSHTDGYVMRWVPEDHPLAAMRNPAGYAREHRLVMAESIGRVLLPSETVHHINGDRSDNRLENLELWSKSHPAGQRVDDLVAWAKEILERYPDA